MRLLVFQHVECEHPGKLRDFLRDDGVEWDAVELDEGEPIPDLEDYDALWVMGGPMDVWDTDEHPWLVPEKEAIRRWVRELERPFLGVCLGHQLLADALGGACGWQRPPEIGVLEVELTAEGRADPIFAGMAERGHALQWHSVCVQRPPDGAAVLASSPLCEVQAMRVGPRAWSMQYHVEAEPDTVANWAAIDAYRAALEAALGPGAAEDLAAEVDRRIDDFTADAERLYRNFMAAVPASASLERFLALRGRYPELGGSLERSRRAEIEADYPDV